MLRAPAPCPCPCPTSSVPDRRQSGAMLIVALGILTLLSVLAVVFVSLMTLERAAAVNYVDGVKAELLSEAGVSRLVASIRQTAALEPYSSPNAPWVYRQGDYTVPVEELTPAADPYFDGLLGRSYPPNGRDEYRVKMVDTSALLDLNLFAAAAESRQKVFADMLDTLGFAIARQRSKPNPIENLVYGQYRGGLAVIHFRKTLDGGRFTSKTQLRRLFEDNDRPASEYEVIKDFVTVHAWEDPKAVVALGHSAAQHHDVELEARPPLNANLAPPEVLAAAIAPLGGRRLAFFVQAETQRIEEANPDQPFATYEAREETTYNIYHGFVYFTFGRHDAAGRIRTTDMEKALRIANWIVNQRRTDAFKSPSDLNVRLSDPATNGDVVSSLPDPNEALAFPAQDPYNDVRAFLNWPTPTAFREWANEAALSILKSAFNPSFVASSRVPNSGGAFPVDKGSLVFPDKLDNPATAEGTLRSTQTVDLCYGTRGVYEITSLGEVRGPKGELVAQEKIMTVVQVLDHLTHRSQHDFEKWDFTYGQSGARDGSTTYPETDFLFSSESPRVDQPDLRAVRPWGHLEIAPRIHFTQFGAFPDIASGEFGEQIFALYFEGRQPGKPEPIYMNADVANKVPTADPLAPGNYAQVHGTVIPESAPGHPRPREDFGNRTLFRDGLYTSARGSHDIVAWYRAAADRPDRDASGGAPDRGLLEPAPEETSIEGDHHAGNLWYRKGAVEFWWKPEFDWCYVDGNQYRPNPLFCGLVFGSQVRKNPGDATAGPEYVFPPAGMGLDGTQIYVFRNSAGELRASRLYYRVVGQDGNDIPKPFHDPKPDDTYPTGTIAEYRYAAEKRGTDEYPWPPKEMKPDEAITYARVEAFVPFDTFHPTSPAQVASDGEPWRANEWHHVAIYWNDAAGSPDEALRVYVDGRKESTAFGLPQDPTTAQGQYQFVRLNEDWEKEHPRDHLYVACLLRLQQTRQEGVFKHQSQWLPPGASAGQNFIQLFAHGTVDDVHVWNAQNDPGTTIASSPSRLPPRRFEPSARYVNAFDLASRFQAGGKPLEAASVSWNVLLPQRHGGAIRRKAGQTWAALEFRVENDPGGGGRRIGGGQSVGSGAVRTERDQASLTFGGATALSGTVVLDPGQTIVYDINLQAISFDGRGGTGGLTAVDTPVVQEVTMSYFLPFEYTWLRERIID